MAVSARRQAQRTIITESGVERAVGQDELMKLVESDRTVLSPSISGTAGVRLWDCIDGQWTNPLPADKVTNYLHYHNVLKCSGCKYTSGTEQGVTGHVRTRLNAWNDHQGEVSIEQGLGYANQPSFTCGGCGDSFNSRTKVQRHIEWVQHEGPLHQGASAIFMARFALQQPVSDSIKQRIPAPVGEALVEEESQASVERRSKRRRRRRRGRGHKEVAA